MDNSILKLRRARQTDAARIAELSGELGYPATEKEMKTRLAQLKPAAQHAVFLAEADKLVVGWIHVSVSPLLEVPRRAEVNGLIVSDGQRSHGAGAELLEAAEKWARAKGCKGMSVRSNVIRDRAHLFYERHGYVHFKTQKAFRKPL